MVIAGGHCGRFGGEKAAASLMSKPLLLWAAHNLRRTCLTVAVNAAPDTEAAALAKAEHLPLVSDDHRQPRGPLASIRSGLMWASRLRLQALVVSPCDMPMLPAELFAQLVEAAQDGGAVMAEAPQGALPLCSVWPTDALEAVDAALRSGRHVTTWLMLQKLNARHVAFPETAPFEAIHSRMDLADLANRLDREAFEHRSVHTGPTAFSFTHQRGRGHF